MNGFSVWSWWVLSHGYVVREIMEATRRPSKFKFVYLAVVFYTFSVTIPSAVSTYWAFGDILLHRSNAFAVLPPSPWRTFAIVSIILHQVPPFSAALCVWNSPKGDGGYMLHIYTTLSWPSMKHPAAWVNEVILHMTLWVLEVGHQSK